MREALNSTLGKWPPPCDSDVEGTDDVARRHRRTARLSLRLLIFDDDGTSSSITLSTAGALSNEPTKMGRVWCGLNKATAATMLLLILYIFRCHCCCAGWAAAASSLRSGRKSICRSLSTQCVPATGTPIGSLAAPSSVASFIRFNSPLQRSPHQQTSS